MTVQEIKKILEEEEYECYGLRCDENDIYNVGDTCNNSHNWWQDDPEDGSEYNEDMRCWDGGELDGTCAIEIHYPYTDKQIETAIKLAKTYNNPNTMYLIGSNVTYGGNDRDEIIMQAATVLLK